MIHDDWHPGHPEANAYVLEHKDYHKVLIG